MTGKVRSARTQRLPANIDRQRACAIALATLSLSLKSIAVRIFPASHCNRVNVKGDVTYTTYTVIRQKPI